MASGHFFQIDRLTWERACSCGLNAAVAYLVLACGTGSDNRTTSWSVAAIERFTAISRGRAKTAVETLIRRGLVKQTKVGAHPQAGPRYELIIKKRPYGPPDPDWIWLPNSIVKGVGTEVPPVERIRSLHDVRILGLFVMLYHQHALADDGGISFRAISTSYDKRRLTERGRWVIWAFSRAKLSSRSMHLQWPYEEEPLKDFWAAWEWLTDFGLLQCVPHLVEANSDEANLIMPCPTPGDDVGTEMERALGHAANELALGLLADTFRGIADQHDYIMPVEKRFPGVEMVDVYRLRYRPKTRATAAWIAQEAQYEKLINAFDGELGRDWDAGKCDVEPDRLATSR